MLVLAMEFSRYEAPAGSAAKTPMPGTLEGLATRKRCNRNGRSARGRVAPSKRNRRIRTFGWDALGGNFTFDGRVGLGLE